MREIRPAAFPYGFENSMFTGTYLASADVLEGDPACVSTVGGGAGAGAGLCSGGAQGERGNVVVGGAVVDVI